MSKPVRKKILLVDDEPGLLIVTKSRLLVLGYEVVTAVQGKECLEKASVEKPDLIMLDIMMPEMDGYETLEELKKAEETREIPVVMFSVKDVPLDTARSKELGAVDFITKPFVPKELLEKIQANIA